MLDKYYEQVCDVVELSDSASGVGVYVGRRCDIGGNLEPACNNKISPTKSKNPISEQGVEHLITFSWI